MRKEAIALRKLFSAFFGKQMGAYAHPFYHSSARVKCSNVFFFANSLLISGQMRIQCTTDLLINSSVTRNSIEQVPTSHITTSTRAPYPMNLRAVTAPGSRGARVGRPVTATRVSRPASRCRHARQPPEGPAQRRSRLQRGRRGRYDGALLTEASFETAREPGYVCVSPTGRTREGNN